MKQKGDKENPHQFGPGGGFIGAQLAKKNIPKKTPKVHDDDFEFVLKNDLSPCIPEGAYQVQYVSLDKRLKGNAPKLLLKFKILTSGDFNDATLFMACSNPNKPGDGSKLIHMVTIALGERPVKNYRLSYKKIFGGKIFNADVRTVKTNWKQQPIPKEAYYSVIDKLISREQ